LNYTCTFNLSPSLSWPATSFGLGAVLSIIGKTLGPVPSFWIGAELFFVGNIAVDFPVIVRDYSGDRFGDN